MRLHAPFFDALPGVDLELEPLGPLVLALPQPQMWLRHLWELEGGRIRGLRSTRSLQ